MNIAIIHYWLNNLRGGEKVIESICDIFPDADIYTHLYNQKLVSPKIRSHKIYTTFIDRLPFSKKIYKQYLLLMPFALEKINFDKYNIVISSESGPAKGIVTPTSTCHICYCHSPMRYLWNMFSDYYRDSGFINKLFWNIFILKLRNWDYSTSSRVDYFIANSENVRKRIRKYYRRDAVVINPPVDFERFNKYKNNDKCNYFFILSEFVPYKRIDLAIQAFNKMDNKKLLIGGTGPQKKYLESIAGENIDFLGRIADSELPEYYSKAKAFIFPGEEDFGITPLESMAAGTPVIAYGKGGALETVIDGKTGLFFQEQTIESLIDAVNRFENDEAKFDQNVICERASEFDVKIFQNKLKKQIAHFYEEYQCSIPIE